MTGRRHGCDRRFRLHRNRRHVAFLKIEDGAVIGIPESKPPPFGVVRDRAIHVALIAKCTRATIIGRGKVGVELYRLGVVRYGLLVLFVHHPDRSASVARGTFYQYFRSKKEIFDDLLDQLFDQVTAAVAPIAIAAPEQMAVAVRANIEGLCRRLQENLPMGRVLLEQAVGINEAGREQLRAFYKRVLDRIEPVVFKS